MRQELVAKAIGAHGGAVQYQIVKKLVGEVEEYLELGNVWVKNPLLANEHIATEDAYGEIEAFGKFTHTDFALELRGNKLWLFSVSVREVRA